jgi:hypothetical protein
MQFIVCALWVCSFCILGLQSVIAVDHASRLEDIVSRKMKDSHAANVHANNLLSGAKVRLEGHLAAAKARSPAVSDELKRVHDERVLIANERGTKSPEHVPSVEPKMHSTLEAHGVSDSLVREINNMASSYIPRETIVKHVQTHFPNKDQHEWNDIVISAISVAGKVQPDSLDTTKSSKNAANMQKQQFERAKQTLGNIEN